MNIFNVCECVDVCLHLFHVNVSNIFRKKIYSCKFMLSKYFPSFTFHLNCVPSEDNDSNDFFDEYFDILNSLEPLTRQNVLHKTNDSLNTTGLEETPMQNELSFQHYNRSLFPFCNRKTSVVMKQKPFCFLGFE